MRTTWNIRKSETNRLKGHIVSKYENSPHTFNNNFLSVAEKIVQSISCSDTKGTNDNRNPIYYLSKTFHNPFPNIKM
jgi:hypothetical protein